MSLVLKRARNMTESLLFLQHRLTKLRQHRAAHLTAAIEQEHVAPGLSAVLRQITERDTVSIQFIARRIYETH